MTAAIKITNYEKENCLIGFLRHFGDEREKRLIC